VSRFGIDGFEQLVPEGIPKAGAVLLLVPPGEEKDQLAAQFVLEGLRNGEAAILIGSEAAIRDLVRRMGNLGFDADKAVALGRAVPVDWDRAAAPKDGNPGGLPAIEAALSSAVASAKEFPSLRVVVDPSRTLPESIASLSLEDIATKLLAITKASGALSLFLAPRARGVAPAVVESFDMVLDLRQLKPSGVGLAVVAIGGTPLPRSGMVLTLSEGRLLLEAPKRPAAAPAASVECPVCKSTIPAGAAECPVCKSPRPIRGAGEPEVLDYIEALGQRVGLPGAPLGGGGPEAPAPPPAPAPAGKEGAPARPEPAPRGLTNGLAKKRKMAAPAAPQGRVNGLTSTIAAARRGMTNGLTNGNGFTNGLGGRRALLEARRSRWKLYLVPLLAGLLLLTPMLLPEPASRPRFGIDGTFDEWDSEWAREPGYEQTPPAAVNPSVALTGYKVLTDSGALQLYATVRGPWFDDPAIPQTLFVFVDRDRNPGSGYRVQDLGADLMAFVEGTARTVTRTSLRTFSGNDPHNWSAWQSLGSVSAAVGVDRRLPSPCDLAPCAMELSIPWDELPGTDPLIFLMAEDGRGSRTFSAVAFSLEPGAVRVRATGLAGVVTRGTPDVLAIELEAFGGPVNVTDVDLLVTNGTAIRPGQLPVTLARGGSQTLTVRIDTSLASPGSRLRVELRGVTSDRPALIVGGPIVAYVEFAPPGKTVDGWFGDWGPEISTDTDPATVDADRDIVGYAANRTGSSLFLYADVRGEILAGAPAPVRHTGPPPSGEPQPPTPPPPRVVGEDVFRVYVDVDRTGADGVPILGLRGADLILEVRGIYGRITQLAAFEWRAGWQPLPVPGVARDEQRIEASLPVPPSGSIEVVFETSGWAGPADSTPTSGTRGVRAGPPGVLLSEGRFTVGFSSSGRVELEAGRASIAWTLPPIPDAPLSSWTVAVTPVGVIYSGPGVEVRYTVDAAGLKEEFVLLDRPSTLPALAFPFELLGDAMVWLEAGRPAAIYDGDQRVFEFAPPFAIDAGGIPTPLALETDVENRLLRIPLPDALLADSAYPLIIDPVVNYTLRNDGPAYKQGEHMGYSVAVADFNGDGYADILTGAPDNNRGGTAHGYAYIYFGPFAANKTTPDISINGTTPSTQFGYSLAAGKFNDDAYWDALIARKSGLVGSGNISIYFGGSSFDTTVDVQFTPPSSPQNFGWWVAAGNVDNAFYDDVLIAEEGRDNDGGLPSQDGAVFLYKSPFSSIVSSANYTLFPNTNVSGHFGRSFAVGKIDSDAYADVVVGESVYGPPTNTGRVHLFKGSLFTSGSGNRYPSATISAPSSGGTGQFGASISVGVLNGDSYADVLVGAPLKNSSAGSAYIYLANSDGTGLSAGASPSVTLSNQSSSEQFGMVVLVADFDDDGTADAMIGAPFAAAGGTNRGRVYWFDDPLGDQTVDATFSGSQNTERFGWSLASGKFGSDPRTILAIGAYLWDKNAGNPSDNDGRVVVASIPEGPVMAFLFIALVLPIAARRVRTRVRGRRPR